MTSPRTCNSSSTWSTKCTQRWCSTLERLWLVRTAATARLKFRGFHTVSARLCHFLIAIFVSSTKCGRRPFRGVAVVRSKEKSSLDRATPQVRSLSKLDSLRLPSGLCCPPGLRYDAVLRLLVSLMVRDWRSLPAAGRLLTNERPPRGSQCVTAPGFA